MSGLAAIVYIALGPTPEPNPPLNPDARQRFLAPTGPSQPLARLAPRQFDETTDPLIDQTVDAVASGSVELTSTLLERIAKLESGALMPALDDRLAARMSAAVAAGRTDEARRMEEVYVLAYSTVGRRDPLTASNQRSFQSPRTAIPGASNTNTDGSAQHRETAQEPGFPPSGSVSAEQPGAVGDGDREGLSPNAAAPAPPSAAPEQNVDGASPAILAKVTPPHSPSTHSAEQLGAAGSGDRAPLSPNAAAPAPPRIVPDQNVDETPPQIAANSPPPDSPNKLSADQLGAARNRDRAPLSPGAAASLAPASADPEQNVDRARVAIPAKAAPITPGDHKAQVAAALPALAPVRVVLNVARGDLSHAADIQHALVAAGVQADLVPVDARRPTASIGYYFQSDRDAAAGLSHLLTPLLGAVDPVALRIRGSIPEPGTIEIAVP